MTTEWRQFACQGSKHRWRQLDDGTIELDEAGNAPTDAWKKDVDTWRPLIESAAAKTGVPPAYVAAIMASESGGKKGGRFDCAKLANGKCAQNEGAGLMAMLPSTAKGVIGYPVSSEELIADNELAIYLGAKHIAGLLANKRTGGGFPGGDFVYMAISYNAGSPRCGIGSTWVAEGSGTPRLPCPNDWGLVMGCVEYPPGSGKIVLSNYPTKAIQHLNTALRNGYGMSLTAKPSDSVPPLTASVAPVGRGGGLLIGGAAAFAGFRLMAWLKTKLKK